MMMMMTTDGLAWELMSDLDKEDSGEVSWGSSLPGSGTSTDSVKQGSDQPYKIKDVSLPNEASIDIQRKAPKNKVIFQPYLCSPPSSSHHGRMDLFFVPCLEHALSPPYVSLIMHLISAGAASITQHSQPWQPPSRGGAGAMRLSLISFPELWFCDSKGRKQEALWVPLCR